MISVPVFFLIGEVGVRRTEFCFHFVISLRAGVLVPDKHGERSSEGQSLEYSREYLDLIILVPGRGKFALPRSPSIEVGLYVFLIQGQAGRASVDYDPNSPTMAFSP